MLTRSKCACYERHPGAVSLWGRGRRHSAFSRGCSTRRRGTFAPLPPARHGLAIAAVRAMFLAPPLSDAGRLASERLEPIARAPSSCPSRPRPQRASAARQRPTHGATSAERSWGRAFRATRGARSEVMIGGGVRATRGARSEVGPSSSRRDAGPGCDVRRMFVFVLAASRLNYT